MRSVAAGFCLLVLMGPLLAGCQKQRDANPSGVVTPAEPRESVDPTRARWQKDKAEIFAAVEKCQLAPEEAIRQLEKRRSELAPAVKDGRALGFRRSRVAQIARKAGCAGA